MVTIDDGLEITNAYGEMSFLHATHLNTCNKMLAKTAVSTDVGDLN
jgi:hypothetical protein